MNKLPVLAMAVFVCAFAWARPTQAEELPAKYRDSVKKGLEYLKKQQAKDGHWAANGNAYPVSMTGLAGLAMLMEGSTVREGQYSANIRKAVDWLVERSQRATGRDGLVGNPNDPGEANGYMYGHGFATLFLASAYGDEDDKERREKLKDILTRAAKYCGNAQSSKGGWYYTSASDGHDQDEGSVTVTQMQALRACKNAGIPVNKAVMQKGYDYLKKSTTQNGGVVYSLGQGVMNGQERPALTAAAIACLFSAGEYKDPMVQKWFKYCKKAIPIGPGRVGHDEYTHFYFAQSVYFLGDDGWQKMFGATPEAERMTWSVYRSGMFEHLVKTQTGDGSWPAGGGFSVGPVFSTSIYCTIMQLDLGTLPIFQR